MGRRRISEVHHKNRLETPQMEVRYPAHHACRIVCCHVLGKAAISQVVDHMLSAFLSDFHAKIIANFHQLSQGLLP